MIALAVNDWYTNLQLRGQEIAYVRNIRDDLAIDRANLEANIRYNEDTARVIRELVTVLDDSSAQVDEPTLFLRQLKRAGTAYFFHPVATTFAELSGGGNLSLITDRDFLRAVIDYHHTASFVSSLDEPVRNAMWRKYYDALAEVIEPMLLVELTEDIYKAMSDESFGPRTPMERMNDTSVEFSNEDVDLTRLRDHPTFRTALARNLDSTSVQNGAYSRLLRQCEAALQHADNTLARIR